MMNAIACRCDCHVLGPLIMHDQPCCELATRVYLEAHTGRLIIPKLIEAIQSSMIEISEVKTGRMELLEKALQPLASIANAYDKNELDEVRPEWGEGLEHDCNVEILSGSGGKTLLTLQDALSAREALRGTK